MAQLEKYTNVDTTNTANTAPNPNASASIKASSRNTHPRKCEHFVKFYETEDHLYDSISRFVLPSFFSLENAAIIVATQSHLQALEHHLVNQNLMPELLKERRQLKLLNAHDVLEILMPGGKLAPQEFENYFRPLFRDVQKSFTKVLAYGELVNILCEQGKHEVAHELEKVWDHFLAGQNVSLLCGYHMNVFRSNGLDSIFQKICRSHSHVEPSEDGYLDLQNPQDQAIAIAMLQQKSKCLEDEVGRRKAAENALQMTLENLTLTSSDTVPVREIERYRTRFATLPFGVCIATTVGGALKYFVNKRFTEMTGMSPEKIQQEDGWIGAVHPADRERVSQLFTFRGDGSAGRNHKYRLTSNTRTFRWVYGEMMGNRLGYVHTIEDIQDPIKLDYGVGNGNIGVNVGPDPYPYRQIHGGGGRGGGGGGSGNDRVLNSVSLASEIYGSNLAPGFSHSPMRLNQAGFYSRASSENVSNECSPREPRCNLKTEFSKMASVLADVMRDDMRREDAQLDSTTPSLDLEGIQKQLGTVQATYDELQEHLTTTTAMKRFTTFDHHHHHHKPNSTDNKFTLQLFHAAYLGSIIILTRPVFVRLANESLQTKFTVNEQSLEGTFTNRCISATRELCKVLAALLNGMNPNPAPGPMWLLTQFSFLVLLVLYLDLSLRRGRMPSPSPTTVRDEITDVATKCWEHLLQASDSDHQAKKYIDILRPFRNALHNPPSTSSQSAENAATPTFLTDPYVLDRAWTKQWSSYPQNGLALGILKVLGGKCGGMSWDEWKCCAWDARFLAAGTEENGWSSEGSGGGGKGASGGRNVKRSRIEQESDGSTGPRRAVSRRELEALFRRVT
ncbi:hypothetical protein RUND412_002472 [Rhizina undulata]